MREDLIERLREAQAAGVGSANLFNLIDEAAAALEAAREALDREAALKGGVEHQRDTLWAELEAAREDAERLDWLADQMRISDLRSAIDQARGKVVADEA